MIGVDLSSVINRPVEEVWAYLTDADNASRWMTGVLKANPISEGAIAVGTKFSKVQRFFGWRTEMIYNIIEYESHKKLAYRTVWGSLSYEASITLKPVESGTKISYVGNGALRGLFRLGEPIFARVAKRRFAHDFNTLKKLLEAQAEVGV